MSSTARIELQPSYLLHRTPYRDTSLLLEALSPDYGRVGLVCRGARRGRSGLIGTLQPFQPLLLSWSGRGELATLTKAEPAGRALPLSGRGLISGFYLNELLMRLTHRHDPQPELFLAYERTLAALTDSQHGEWALRLFERDLLKELGYGLLLTEEAGSGEPVQREARYCYHVEFGPIVVQGEQEGLIVSGATLLALAKSGTPPEEAQRQEAKRLMRQALAPLLGNRPLASRELFRAYGAGGKSD